MRDECGNILSDGHSYEVTLAMDRAQSLALSFMRCFHQLHGEGRRRVEHHNLTFFKRNVAWM